MDPLIALYQQKLKLQNVHFSLIDHEDALVATVFKITKADGKELILKICSRAGDYMRESYFLHYFAGKLPVPRIIGLVHPEAGVDGAILMECLPGELLKIGTLSEKLMQEIGSCLAQIHLNRVAGYGDLTQSDLLSSDPRLPFTMKFEEGLEECEHHLPKALIKKCRHYYDAHLDLLLSADGPCIIHRDFRPGNLIVDQGKLQGIIDWSSGRGGFAEEDFCPLEFGEWSDNRLYKNRFLEGYAKIRPVPDYKAMMPLLRLSRAIATIGFTVKRGTWESKAAKLYQFHRQFLESLLNGLL